MTIVTVIICPGVFYGKCREAQHARKGPTRGKRIQDLVSAKIRISLHTNTAADQNRQQNRRNQEQPLHRISPLVYSPHHCGLQYSCSAPDAAVTRKKQMDCSGAGLIHGAGEAAGRERDTTLSQPLTAHFNRAQCFKHQLPGRCRGLATRGLAPALQKVKREMLWSAPATPPRRGRRRFGHPRFQPVRTPYESVLTASGCFPFRVFDDHRTAPWHAVSPCASYCIDRSRR